MPLVMFSFFFNSLPKSGLLFFFLFYAFTGLTQICLYLWQGFERTESTTVTTKNWPIQRRTKRDAYLKRLFNSNTKGIKVGETQSRMKVHCDL